MGNKPMLAERVEAIGFRYYLAKGSLGDPG
jgi:hypothetical protein